MKVTIQEQEGSVVAFLEGRLDTPTASQVEEGLKPLYDCKGQDIIIDCTGLDYICSSGLRIFLMILKSTEENENNLFIKGLSDDLYAVFAMTGFVKLFQFM
jgi:anti-sigma B factor antagonist